MSIDEFRDFATSFEDAVVAAAAAAAHKEGKFQGKDVRKDMA